MKPEKLFIWVLWAHPRIFNSRYINELIIIHYYHRNCVYIAVLPTELHTNTAQRLLVCYLSVMCHCLSNRKCNCCERCSNSFNVNNNNVFLTNKICYLWTISEKRQLYLGAHFYLLNLFQRLWCILRTFSKLSLPSTNLILRL